MFRFQNFRDYRKSITPLDRKIYILTAAALGVFLLSMFLPLPDPVKFIITGICLVFVLVMNKAANIDKEKEKHEKRRRLFKKKRSGD